MFSGKSLQPAKVGRPKREGTIFLFAKFLNHSLIYSGVKIIGGDVRMRNSQVEKHTHPHTHTHSNKQTHSNSTHDVIFLAKGVCYNPCLPCWLNLAEKLLLCADFPHPRQTRTRPLVEKFMHLSLGTNMQTERKAGKREREKGEHETECQLKRG